MNHPTTLRGLFVLLATIAQGALAAPQIFVWPDVVRICTAAIVARGPEASPARVPFTRNVYPVTIINRGDSELRISDIPFSLTDAIVEPVRNRVNGGNFVLVDAVRPVIEAPPEFAILPEAPPNPFLVPPAIVGTTNCVDAVGNSVGVPPGGSCQINLRGYDLKADKGGRAAAAAGEVVVVAAAAAGVGVAAGVALVVVALGSSRARLRCASAATMRPSRPPG